MEITGQSIGQVAAHFLNLTLTRDFISSPQGGSLYGLATENNWISKNNLAEAKEGTSNEHSQKQRRQFE